MFQQINLKFKISLVFFEPFNVYIRAFCVIENELICAVDLCCKHKHDLIRHPLCFCEFVDLHICPQTVCNWARVCFTSRAKHQEDVITAIQMALGGMFYRFPDLQCWPTSVQHAVYRLAVTQEQNNRIITMSYSEACCCSCCSKKCHPVHCWVAVGSIKQRIWLTIALLSV